MSTSITTEALTKAKARKLTDEVKADATALWAKLLELYEGEAHKALGYKSWGAYFEAEFGQTGSYGYKLLNAAKVAPLITLPGNGTPPTETADALAPILKAEGEQAVKETYDQAVAEHGPKPTAKQVKETVQARDEIKQTIIARAGRGDAQKDIAKDVDLPITEVAKIVQAERTAAKPKRKPAKAAPKAPPTLGELIELATEHATAAKALTAAMTKYKKTGDLEDGRQAMFAAAAAGSAAAALADEFGKHLDHKEPTT